MEPQNPIDSNNTPYGDDLSLKEILRVTFSHLGLIGSVLGTFLVTALLYAFFWPPTYQASATVKVPDSSQSASGMLKELVPYSGSGDPIQTYVEVCRSENVAERVAKILNIQSRSEYAGLSTQ